MKHTCAYILFVLYSFAVFGLMIPILKDGFSHVFAKAIHIATVHALYGSNHVDKELENATENSAKDHHIVKHAESHEVYTTAEQRDGLTNGQHGRLIFFSYRNHFVQDVLIFIQSPPPRLS